MRLIDADLFKQLISTIATESKFDPEGTHACLELIDKQPTAFDVEAVVKQLEDYRSDFMDNVYCILQSEPDNYNANHIIDMFDETIEIVRKGGVK